MNELVIKDCQHVLLVNDANLESSRFHEVRLAQIECKVMTFEQSNFSEGSFEQSTFKRIRFDGCVFQEVSLCDVQIKSALYQGMTIEGIPVTEMLDLYRSSRKTGNADANR